MKSLEQIVIVGAARTPVGAYLGDLKTVPVEELGRIALEEAINRAGIKKKISMKLLLDMLQAHKQQII